MSYHLSSKSLKNLYGVDEDLAIVVLRAITLTHQDFAVFEGLRTLERQKQLKADGYTRTLKSYHLRGKAVDLVAWRNGRLTWEVDALVPVGMAMKEASKQLGIPITWGATKKHGGDWNTFNDMAHFQIED